MESSHTSSSRPMLERYCSTIVCGFALWHGDDYRFSLVAGKGPSCNDYPSPLRPVQGEESRMSHIPQLLSWPVTNQKRGPSDPQDLTSNFIVDTRMIGLISLILSKRESSPGPCQPSILHPCHGIGAGCLGHRHECRGEVEHGFTLGCSMAYPDLWLNPFR